VVARDSGVGAGRCSAAVSRRVGRNCEPGRALRRKRVERAHRLDAARCRRADLAALERQLKDEVRTIQTSSRSQTMQTPPASRVAATPDAEVLRLVHAIVDESEKRQQRELALRVAEVMRDVTAQRRTDLVNIDRMLGFVQDKVGVEVMKDRQRLDLLYRASQRQ
jgi:hypothetical protein